MKILLAALVIYLSFVFEAFAYLEVDSKGDAKATANEQTTNLYLLTNSNNTTLKKLKKIEELYKKTPDLAQKMSAEELAQIAGGNSQELRRADVIRETTQYIKQMVRKKNTFIVKRDVYFYQQLTNTALQSTTDRRIVDNLSAKIRRLP